MGGNVTTMDGVASDLGAVVAVALGCPCSLSNEEIGKEVGKPLVGIERPCRPSELNGVTTAYPCEVEESATIGVTEIRDILLSERSPTTMTLGTLALFVGHYAQDIVVVLQLSAVVVALAIRPCLAVCSVLKIVGHLDHTS